MVPCFLSLNDSDLSSPMANLPSELVLPYAKCVESIVTGQPISLPSIGKEVKIQDVAPDLSMGTVKVIDPEQVKTVTINCLFRLRIYTSCYPVTEQLVAEKEVGRGGFGAVFKGSWQGRPVAIKQLHADFLDAKNQQKFDEFKQEVFLMKYSGPKFSDCFVKTYLTFHSPTAV